ncbi:MAG: hypothetical protein IKY44_01730 [Clostridia bacterium]|jgi:hypothetical protein|nr:hypothetical protein [Clostridia bacterium]
MSKKKFFPIIGAIFCTILLTSVLFVTGINNSITIRNKYPLIKSTDYQFDIMNMNFTDSVKYAPNIAELEIVECLPNYAIIVEDKEANISSKVIFKQYKARVLDDIAQTQFEIDNDGTITICFAECFAKSYPNLTSGLKIICSIEPAAKDHLGKYLLYDKVFYYIDNELALAAYEGDTSPASKYCSKLDLIQEIKCIRNSIAN